MSKPSLELWLELETRCNLACRFCYNYWTDGSAAEPQSRTTSETVAALRMLFEAAEVTQVAFSGGEPLLRPDLLDLVRLAQTYGIHAILTTNGTLLTRPRIAELRDAGIGTFQISLHSHLPDMHDFLSGGTAWHGAIGAMIRLREAGLPVVPVFVATNLNLSHFPRVVAMMGQLGVRDIIFNRFIPTGLGSLHRNAIGVPGERQLIAVLSEADIEASAHGIRIHLGTPIEVPNSTTWSSVDLASCPVQPGQRRWTLSADLNLRRCNQSGANIGNVFGDGIRKLVSELKLPPPRPEGTVRSCNHLGTHRLVELRTR
jgi:MoaA/NifB/PqqE/SkfB family radical SAM enzyme